MEFDAVLPYLPVLLEGAKTTLLLTVAALPVALGLGLVITALRLSRIRILMGVGQFWVNFLRVVPMVVQIFWIYYVLPILTGISLPAFLTGVVALGFAYSSNFAELIRAGILAIPQGQRDAALSQGMTSRQLMRRIILPQATLVILPPATGSLVSLLKDSSILGILAVGELLYEGQTLMQFTFRPLEVLTVVAILYFLLTYPLTIISNLSHRALRTRFGY